MGSNLKVRLFQSIKSQESSKYLIQPEDLTTQDLSIVEKIYANAERFSKEEVQTKKEIASLQNPFSELPVDEQLQFYLDGRNEWKKTINEEDIVKIEFSTAVSSVKEHLRKIHSILLLHKVPK
jgi:hypothetical protein